ncbi:MAG: hypothetical protein KBS95_06265 [Alistipes sp.]|nr:hypothetical protein [Candidatus Alistipes equi]
MEQFYRIVLELYKQALQGNLKKEAVEAAQVLLAKEITKAHVMGESDIELEKLSTDVRELKFQMLE